MKRSEFLKILGITAISPSLLITSGDKMMPASKFNPKRWPIYPEVINFSRPEYTFNVCHTFFSYVKINRNNMDYLIPVREIGVNDRQMTKERFEHEVKMVQENFIVDEQNHFLFDNKFIIKYDSKIHRN